MLRISWFPSCYGVIPRDFFQKNCQRNMQARQKFSSVFLSQKAFRLAYVLHDRLYLSLTNESPTTGILETRGPGFKMPESSKFAILLHEPTPEELVMIIDDTYHQLCITEALHTTAHVPIVTFAGSGNTE